MNEEAGTQLRVLARSTPAAFADVTADRLEPEALLDRKLVAPALLETRGCPCAAFGVIRWLAARDVG